MTSGGQRRAAPRATGTLGGEASDEERSAGAQPSRSMRQHRHHGVAASFARRRAAVSLPTSNRGVCAARRRCRLAAETGQESGPCGCGRTRNQKTLGPCPVLDGGEITLHQSATARPSGRWRRSSAAFSERRHPSVSTVTKELQLISLMKHNEAAHQGAAHKGFMILNPSNGSS
jgi:hypothetical protein